MGISRLVYGRSARQGLYLLPEQWLNTVPPGSICVGDACNSASATRCPSTA